MKKLMLGNEAVARGAYEGGCDFGSGYPGTPSTEILEALKDYDDVVVQWAPNEKVGYEVAMGVSLSGKRAIVTMKHVGLNVASDPLFSSSYMGVNGGLVCISADDPNMHSSQDEQDNRLIAKAAKVLMVEPCDPEESRWMTKEAFELSEQFDSPVILRMTTRVCHQSGLVEEEERVSKKEKFFVKDIPKYVMLPANARQRRHKVEERLVNALKFGNESDKWNPIFNQGRKIGIITSGVSFGYVYEIMGEESSILKLGFTNPLPLERMRKFAESVEKLYVVEELEPYIEDAMKAMGFKVFGSELRPYTGELNLTLVERMLKGEESTKITVDLSDVNINQRPPTLCPGCSHRGMFTMFRDMGLKVMGDIGCYTLGAVNPLKAMDSCMCMGASVGMAEGLVKFDKDGNKVIGVIGDSTFYHSGITGLIDMVTNKSTGTIVILNNDITAMTGGQPHPGTGFNIKGEDSPKIDLAEICKAVGVKRVRTVDPYNLEEVKNVLEEEISAKEVSVIIAKAPCVLTFKVNFNKVVVVDLEKCTRCGKCIRVGCMAIGERDGYPVIDETLCIGCGICVDVCDPDAMSLVERKKG
jgi:indolepyruvate ferredoxin oxidoreductase alpha subunit